MIQPRYDKGVILLSPDGHKLPCFEMGQRPCHEFYLFSVLFVLSCVRWLHYDIDITKGKISFFLYVVMLMTLCYAVQIRHLRVVLSLV